MSLFLLVTALAAGPGAACAPSSDGFVEPSDLAVAQCFPAPRGDMRVRTKGGQLVLERGDARYSLGQVDGGYVHWSPNAASLVFTDNEGSGQSSYLYVVDPAAPKPARSGAMGDAAVSLFKQRFGCRGPNTYVYVWVHGWSADGRLRLVVQEGPHSEGCRTLGGTVGMVVEPKRARVLEVLGEGEMRRQWCTMAQRVQHGYCYDRSLVLGLKRPGRKK